MYLTETTRQKKRTWSSTHVLWQLASCLHTSGVCALKTVYQNSVRVKWFESGKPLKCLQIIKMCTVAQYKWSLCKGRLWRHFNGSNSYFLLCCRVCLWRTSLSFFRYIWDNTWWSHRARRYIQIQVSQNIYLHSDQTERIYLWELLPLSASLLTFYLLSQRGHCFREHRLRRRGCGENCGGNGEGI